MTQQIQTAPLFVGHRAGQLKLLHLRVSKNLIHGKNRATGQVGGSKHLDPVSRRPLTEGVLNQPAKCFPVLQPGLEGRKARVVTQFWQSDRFAEAIPMC